MKRWTGEMVLPVQDTGSAGWRIEDNPKNYRADISAESGEYELVVVVQEKGTRQGSGSRRWAEQRP